MAFQAVDRNSFTTTLAMLKIGIVGYSRQSFDTERATQIVQQAILKVDLETPDTIAIVSGWTNLGIPKLAYEFARQRGYITVGIACEKAFDYDLFPVDIPIVVGEDWTDESPVFIYAIDVLIRVGGGKQSFREVRFAKAKGIPVYEYELEAITSV